MSSSQPPSDLAASSPNLGPRTPQFPNPNVQNNAHVYMAVYSSVQVYEMMVNGIGVMRRCSDSMMNATQILKVAGVPKSKRNRIVEREIILGEHEKIKGGYGRYQGTWIPFWRAQELTIRFGVLELLAPLFDYLPGPTSGPTINPSKSMSPYAPELNVEPDSGIRRIVSRQPSTQSLSAKRERLHNTSLLPSDQPEPGPSKRSRLNTPSHQSNASQQTPPVPNDQSHQLFDPTFASNPSTHSQPQLLAHSFASRRAPLPGPSSTSPNGLSCLKKSTPASRPIPENALKTEKNVHALMSVFANLSDANDLRPAATSLPAPQNALADVNQTLEDPELDIDTPIDEHCHTALHWAAALARLDLVRAFFRAGADVNRGNNVGETALVRATLVTNNYDRESFNQLLELLHPSLWTLDTQDRTVLHHVCLAANIKGRAESSRYYMECIFEWIVNRHGGRFESSLIDAVDLNGDTALNIAARVGNKHLVRMLLDVGADKTIGNKLGLKPTDFGVEAEENSTNNGNTSASLGQTSLVSAPAPKSRDIIASMTALINCLSNDFDNEIAAKTDHLDRVRVQLKAATRELTDQRRQIDELKRDLDERALLELRFKKLRAAIAEEDGFDWTGRSEIDGRPAQAGKAFEHRGPGSTVIGLSAAQIQLQLEIDPSMPEVNNAASLVYLRRMEKWYKRVLGLLRERIGQMKGCNLEQEAKYLKVIGSFIGNMHTNEAISELSRHQQRPSQTMSIHDVLNSGPVEAQDTVMDVDELTSSESPSLLVEKVGGHAGGEDKSERRKTSIIDSKLLNQLMAAIEADGPELDLNRVAGFMQRVHSGLL